MRMFSLTNQSTSQKRFQHIFSPQPFNRDLTMNFVSKATQSSYKNPSAMSMLTREQQLPQYSQQPPQITNLREAIKHQSNSIQDDNKPKMVWGKYTWILFHTIAEQIKEERFLQLRNEIVHIIYTICTNLPCPMCADHAKEYLSKSRILQSQTKEELKYELFKFHNTVNLRKNAPQFTQEQLNQMYSRAIPKVVFQNFLVHFNSRSKNIKLLADELHRQNTTQYLKSWFEIHLNDFNDPSNPYVEKSPLPSSRF